MTIEIELKFIATPQAADRLGSQLAAWPHQYSAPIALTNIYYETPDNQLRRWDMGLRIRGIGERYEMTLKTAGQTIGGLHQRPEYNVELTQPELDITRLPTEVWPEGSDINALQQQLKPLFTTHFARERWLVSYGNSEIEVALDRGEVSANALSEPLHEIELELKQGELADVLALAAELGKAGGLRPGSLSKAARGYWLAQGKPEQPLRPLPVLQVKPKATIEEGMQAALTLALKHWQYHEELWLRGETAAQGAVLDALETARQAFSLFGGLVPRKASSALRQKLTSLLETLEQKQPEAQAICYSPLWLDTQLSLTAWLSSAGWQPFIDAKNAERLQGSFKRFADIMLGRVAADLKETFSTIRQHNEYQDKSVRLTHHLLTVHLLAGAYPSAAVDSWLQGWQQLAQAIRNHHDRELDMLCRQALRQPAFWLNGKV
ncbi:inorganic triphosphatase [Mixta intestinalis]|uniref:Inorganic triphosphatase n=1 Tax=Mixta intestinalis TaxID=1615494 RepID=A0A6P1Q209_9GAMM|nr:inorganic triphosphatase [Mixta intestinalis]QHM72451.1 Inorganic triphosphatase [Mixta intestinalis]